MIKIFKAEPEVGTIIDSEDIKAVCEELRKFNNPLYDHNKTISVFENEFLKLIGNKYAIAVNSCASGIDMVLRYLSLNPGDEIISCANNFHGTHLSILNAGAKLVLVKANEDINIDVTDLKEKITERTRAIVVTHMNGLSCDMDNIMDAVKGTDIKIIEDAARSLGGKYKGGIIGKNSWACIYSFQYKKMITTLGEGGMIVTNDTDLRNSLIRYRSFGLGEAWGTNFKITSVQAAVGMTQLKRLDSLIEKRRQLALKRTSCITNKLFEFKCPTDNEIYYNVFYLYTILVPNTWSKEKRDILISLMKEKNIHCAIANPPTYEYNKFIYANCPDRVRESELIGNRIICLPIHPDMAEAENKYIVDSFIELVQKIY